MEIAGKTEQLTLAFLIFGHFITCGSFDVDNCIIVTMEAHPVLLLGEVHSELGRSRCEDRPAQKWGRYELNNMRHHLLLLRRLV